MFQRHLVIRDLLEDGYRHRRGGPAGVTDEQRAQLAERSRPGTERQRPPERLRPVVTEDADGGFYDELRLHEEGSAGVS